MDADQRESVVNHFAQQEAERTALQIEYSELLVLYQKLKVQKEVLCKLYSASDQAEQQDVRTNNTYCKLPLQKDPLLPDIDSGSDVALTECKPGTISEDTLFVLDGPERNLVVSRDKQIACDIETLKGKNKELDSAITNVQLEIDYLKGTVDAIQFTESVENEPADSENAIAGLSIPVTVPLLEMLSIRAVNSRAETYLKRFQACENVVKLTPSGCRTVNEPFSPGKVFVFARVVTKINDEVLTLRWFKNGIDEPFSEKQFTVRPNPDGYRTYTWKSLDIGVYRACLFNELGKEIMCIGISVGNPATVARINGDTQVEAKTVRVRKVNTISAESSTATGRGVVETFNQQRTLAQEATHLRDAEDDGFLICEDVVKLKPVQCSTKLDPGRVYAFARIVTPYERETITLHWFRDDVEIRELRKELEVKNDSTGYRTYSWNTFDSGSYAVSLSDQKGNELRKVFFDVK